jgi:hypothetical protein
MYQARKNEMLKKMQPLPEVIQELRIALYEEWEQIPQEQIQHVIESTPKRIETFGRCRGGNILH